MSGGLTTYLDQQLDLSDDERREYLASRTTFETMLSAHASKRGTTPREMFTPHQIDIMYMGWLMHSAYKELTS